MVVKGLANLGELLVQALHRLEVGCELRELILEGLHRSEVLRNMRYLLCECLHRRQRARSALPEDVDLLECLGQTRKRLLEGSGRLEDLGDGGSELILALRFGSSIGRGRHVIQNLARQTIRHNRTSLHGGIFWLNTTATPVTIAIRFGSVAA